MKRLAFILATVAGSAQAHGGHGAETQAHWLSQADHVTVVALAVLGLGLGIGMGLRRLRQSGRGMSRRGRVCDDG